nr:immunoglobulin light chain junction region [Macaca mulatta]MOV66063.1 immunoglobulin light chain junction region [Macaca mulatta]MOV66146.1 immunoglobulin light chain junction region [Macaca mulatta]MOV66342.1 immunoglobulin light chain junction region [Macaca mulatta]MOV66787.1 immunoglobulin light chain junction region [Macaca mulatta]
DYYCQSVDSSAHHPLF